MRRSAFVVAAIVAAACAPQPVATGHAPRGTTTDPKVVPLVGLAVGPVEALSAYPVHIATPPPKRPQRPAQAQQRPIAPSRPVAPPPAPPAPPAPPGGGSVPALIRAYFPAGEEATALCVAWRESRYDPGATNRQTGAAGVFQFMPRTWPVFSRRAGWGGASAYSARANVATAAYAVAHGGWGPWGGGC
jgi:transglycosylase-like protein with SLT domain